MAKTKRRTQVTAGAVVSVVQYTQPMAFDEPRARAAKSKISSAARQKQNHRCSWQKLELLLACNFDRHDLFVTLTYRDAPPTREHAQRQLDAFLRMLRAQRRARGEELLYIKTTEHMTDEGREGRWHHHLVINATGADYEEIRALWARWGDNVDFEDLLDGATDYEARARYMCKERPPLGKQAWTPCRGLRRPVRETRMVDENEALEIPPEARIVARAEERNAWGSFEYVKYVLPRRPKPEENSYFQTWGSVYPAGGRWRKPRPGVDLTGRTCKDEDERRRWA